ncbi:hypothetical protein Vafri_15250, partial [Volvox africanus]
MSPVTADLLGPSHCGGASRIEDIAAATPPLPPPPPQQQEQQPQPRPLHGETLSSASSSALLCAPSSASPPALSDCPLTSSQARTTQQQQRHRHRQRHRLKEPYHDQRYQQQAPPLNVGQEPVTPEGFCNGMQRIWSEVEAQQAAYDVTNNHLPCRPQPPPYEEQRNHYHHHHHHQQQQQQQQQKALTPSALRAVPGCHVLGQATGDNRALSGVLATAAAVLRWCVVAAAAVLRWCVVAAAAVLRWCVVAAAAVAEHQLDSAVKRGTALLDLYRRSRQDERTAGVQDLRGVGRGLEQLGKVQDGREAAAAGAGTTSAGKGDVVSTSPSASTAGLCPDHRSDGGDGDGDGDGGSGSGCGCGGCPAPAMMGPITAIQKTAHTARKGQADAQSEPSCRSSTAVANASLRNGEQLAASAVNAAVEAAAVLGAGGLAASCEPGGEEGNSDSRTSGDDGGGSTGSSSCCRHGRESSSLAVLGRGLGGAERSSPALYRSPLTHAALSIKVTDVGEVAFEEACASLQSAALRAIELLLGGAVDRPPGEAGSVEATATATVTATATATAGRIAESPNSSREGGASEGLGAVDTGESSYQDAAFEKCGRRGKGGGSGG